MLGYNVRAERQMIHVNISSLHSVLNAVHTIETGWRTQLNGDTMFKFCCAEVNTMELGFNSLGAVNNLACWLAFLDQAKKANWFIP